MNRRRLIFTLASVALFGAGRSVATASSQGIGDETRSRCYDVLTAALRDESPWVRVHAAEALISLNRAEPALLAFRPKAQTAEPQYRIVVWRVLAAAEPQTAQRRQYVARIREVLLDPNAPDQAHAMEAMAKLHEPIADDAEQQRVRDVADGHGPVSPFAVWRLAQAKDTTAIDRLVKLLRAEDPTTRARAAYVLGRLRPLPTTASDAIDAALKAEPLESPALPMLQTARGDDAARKLVHDEHASPTARYFATMCLAESGTAEDFAALTNLLDHRDPNVRLGAAYAILQINTRELETNPPSTRPQT